MSEKFIRAYEQYLQTANEKSWNAATRAAKEYAQLADPSVNAATLGPVSREMATVAARQKPAYFRRMGYAQQERKRDSKSNSMTAAENLAERQAKFVDTDSMFDGPLAAPVVTKSRNQIISDALRGLSVGEAVVIACADKDDVGRLQTTMPAIEKLLGWQRVNGAPAYQCRALPVKSMYLNGELKPAFLLRIGRVS